MYPWKVRLGIAEGSEYLGLTEIIKVIADDCDQAIRKAKAITILKPGQRFSGSTTQRAD